MAPDQRSTALRRLARAAGVAEGYHAMGAPRTPPEATLRAVLSELGHPCDDDAAAVRSLRALRRRPWTRAVDPVAVVWRGRSGTAAAQATAVTISAPERQTPTLRLTLEDGADRPLDHPVWGGLADTDHGTRRRGTVALPTDLPLGYHRLEVVTGDHTGTATVIVAPDGAPVVDGRRWGWMLQTYALRSTSSWGQGEFADLGALAEWSAGRGADFLLINPVHAAAPATPRQPSPYSPTSRRFIDPCYLHVPAVPGFAALPDDERDSLVRLPSALAADSDRIDRDAVWSTKRRALAAVFARLGADERAALDAFRRDRGQSLQRYAVFSALAEEHGASFRDWPETLRDPRDDAVARWAERHDARVAFHAWLQRLCEDQVRDAQRRARDAGMAVGVIHDLAVGVDRGGADVWALPEEFARGATVGAPPDAFNAQGQNWAQPPPLPDAMRQSGHRTQREIMATALSTGGGLRIDHILGLSRLFWIPSGGGPTVGTYVRYPADELFAVLVLEAHRGDAIVIGEDLGTVDDRIRRLMRRRDVAGSAVLYFERDGDGRRRAGDYPGGALASVTTHDLPTATGWWDGSAIDVRVDLGLVDEPEDARTEHAREQASMRALLRDHGCLGDATPTVRDLVLAMHRFLAMTPSALVAAAVWDALGDPRQPNMPGTVDAYPNWLLPLARPDAAGPRPVALEQLYEDAAVAELVTVLAEQRPG